MSQPFRTVSKGLRWVFVGCWLTPGIIVASLCLLCVAGGCLGQTGQSLFLGIGLGLVALAAVTTFVAPVGRLMCLATPPYAPVARTRIRLAVIFEACSILSGLSGILITIADLIPGTFLGAGLLFTLLTGAVARLFFLLFARSLAEHIGATDEAVTAKTIFHAAVGLIVSGVLSVGGFAVAGAVPSGQDPAVLRPVVFTLAACLMCLSVMCLMCLGVGYFLLFSTLWRKVRAFADTVEDEGERDTEGEPSESAP
jgi:hypothetical protein